MAYMNQERKQVIAIKLKAVMPTGWKYTLAVRHHSTLVLNISEAPINLVAEYVEKAVRRNFDSPLKDETRAIGVNPYWFEDQFEGQRLQQMLAIRAAMNEGNHDRSDIQTDYFDVGWYIDIHFGRYDRPFKVTRSETIDERIAKLEASNALLHAQLV